MFWPVVIVTVLLLVVVATLANRSKEKALNGATAGAIRIESIKARHVKYTVEQYIRAGWTVVEQSSAKSLGTQARVTITFKKGLAA